MAERSFGGTSCMLRWSRLAAVGALVAGLSACGSSASVAVVDASLGSDAGADTGKAPADAGHTKVTTTDAGTTDARRDTGGSATDTGALTCPPFEEACGSVCVAVQTDPNNCGGCGKTCATGTYCSEAQCGASCIGLTSTLCGGTCVDSQSDYKNCGTCGTACAAGQVCSAGACGTTCASPYVTCGTGADAYCALTNLDPDNCGACGTVCAIGQFCSSGVCGSSCSGSVSLCNGLCLDESTDSANCGACGNACAMGTACAAGKCAASCAPNCSDGTACGGPGDCASGVCTNGKCAAPACAPTCPDGNACGAGSDCASGVCTNGKCAAPACAPTCSDGDACGAAGDCASGVCTSGKCAAPECSPNCADGQSCALATDCTSGVCTAGVCAPPACSPACLDGAACGANRDCGSDVCTDGLCVPDVTVSGTVDLSTTSLVPSRSCADGPYYSVTGLTSTSAALSAAVPTGCLTPGDLVLLIQEQGATGATATVGNYELLRVGTVAGSLVTFAAAKTGFYGAAAGADTNIGTGAGQQRVVLQRVPIYGNVTVSASATLTADPWNGLAGGVVAFRAAAVTVAGTISAVGLGYRGGDNSIDGQCQDSIQTGNGESITGPSTATTAANSGGSGGVGPGSGISFASNTPLSASAGHAIAGQVGQNGNGRTLGPPGASYGVGDGSNLTLGSGAGGTLSCSPGAPEPGVLDPSHQNAGGIIAIWANSVSVTGTITASGAGGDRTAGSGGYVLLEADNLTLGVGLVQAEGAPGATGGFTNTGGYGFIALIYQRMLTGTTNPAATAVMNANLVLP